MAEWSSARALSVCSAATSVLVVSLYVWSQPRRSFLTSLFDLDRAAMDPQLRFDRLAPFHFRRRVLSFTTTIIVTAFVVGRFRPTDGASEDSSFLRQYYVRDGARLCLRSALCTSLLFLGPIVERVWDLVGGDAGSAVAEQKKTTGEATNSVRQWLSSVIGQLVGSFQSRLHDEEQRLDMCRVLIVAPIGEELFFRAVMFDLLRRAPTIRNSTSRLLIASATFFALSHAHHISMYAIEAYRRNMFSGCRASSSAVRDAWRAGVKACIMHCGVVFVFGVLSGGYFMSPICGGNVAATGVAHVICNLVGEPRFSFLSRQASRAVDDDCLVESSARSVVVGSSYVAGLASFVWLAARFTRCQRS